MVSRNSTADVQRSFGRCTHSPGFLDDFHKAFTRSKGPLNKPFGCKDTGQQKQLLKNDLLDMMKSAADYPGAYILTRQPNSDDPSWLHDNWKPALFHSIKKHDALISWALLEEWEEVIQSGINNLTRKAQVQTPPTSLASVQTARQLLVY